MRGAENRSKTDRQAAAAWLLAFALLLLPVLPLRARAAEGAVSPSPAPSSGFTNADYAQHVMELRKKIPGKEFAFVIERPFVVIDDEGAAAVKARAEQTVRWATARLKGAYFAKDPESIIDIWLFKDKESYDAHTRSIFGDTPTTPYGYSSSEHRALIMNIATGGGTLVHEMVHAFMNSNFPECPAWFNEGLGSLYEQSTGQGDAILGLPNWRLPALQEAIRGAGLPSFETLTHTTSAEFYNADRGTNYAQARYLCYYLQEKGLLRKFYQDFTAASAKDPSGYETLKAVLGMKDEKEMAAFQKGWETFVMGLRFP